MIAIFPTERFALGHGYGSSKGHAEPSSASPDAQPL